MDKLFYFLNADLASITPDLIVMVKKTYPNFTDEQARQIINKANKADPTAGTSDSYTWWLVREILKGNLPQDFNTEEVKTVVRLFNVNKPKRVWTKSKDINQFEWQELKDTIDQLKGVLKEESTRITEHPAPVEMPGVRKIYDKGGWQVFEISTVEALTSVSKGTSWCVKKKATALLYIKKYTRLYCIYRNGRTFALWASASLVKNTKDLELSSEDYDKVIKIMLETKILNFDELDSSTWGSLLSKYPNFAQYCDFKKLNRDDIAYIIKYSPELIGYCNLDKLNGRDWAWILSTQPQFAKYCNWDDIDSFHWAALLSERPEFARYCDWSKINEWAWIILLRNQPELYNKYHRSSASLTRFLLEK